MARYTRKMLDADIKAINASLAGSGYYLGVQGRNSYTCLDEYKGNPAEGDSGHCVGVIKCGSPRECLEAAEQYEPREQRSTSANHKSPFGPF